MACPKMMRWTALAATLLSLLAGPTMWEHSSLVGQPESFRCGILPVVATDDEDGGGEDQKGRDDSIGGTDGTVKSSDASGSSFSPPEESEESVKFPEESAGSAEPPKDAGGSLGSDKKDLLHETPKNGKNALRGSSTRRRKAQKSSNPVKTNPMQNIFEGIFKNLDLEDSFDLGLFERFESFMDKVFLPRMQTPPKYEGCLEGINLAINRYIVKGPNSKNRDSKKLSSAYNYIKKPPKALQIDQLLLELRSAVDMDDWKVTNKRVVEALRSRGDLLPERLETPIEELVSQDSANVKTFEEEITAEELEMRLKVLNGWMRQQHRLRVHYIKTYKGKGAVVHEFDPLPDEVRIPDEYMEELSFNAQLDPEPESVVEA